MLHMHVIGEQKRKFQSWPCAVLIVTRGFVDLKCLCAESCAGAEHSFTLLSGTSAWISFFFYMTDPWTTTASAYLTGRRVGRKGPALWGAGTLPRPSVPTEKCHGLCSAGGKTASGGSCAPLGNCPSLLFAGVCSLASYCNCRYSHMAEKHLLLFFCVLQTALLLCFLPLCGTTLRCSLYLGHPVRTKGKSSFKMWFGLQEGSKLTNISKKPLYERRFIVCLFLKACQDVFPTGDTVLFPLTTQCIFKAS